jgi:hypothetical protein
MAESKDLAFFPIAMSKFICGEGGSPNSNWSAFAVGCDSLLFLFRRSNGHIRSVGRSITKSSLLRGECCFEVVVTRTQLTKLVRERNQ